MHGLDKHRAKQVLLEIIRQAGGEFTRKTSLFKAFYFAHLIYAERQAGYLSDWPIVKMPHGPGVEAADVLLSELTASGVMATDHETIGPYSATKYRFTGKELPGEPLPGGAVEAIKEAVEFVQNRSAVELSELTHEFSRSWNAAKEGEHLNIYIDCIPDDEYEKREYELDELQRAMMAAWDAPANESTSAKA